MKKDGISGFALAPCAVSTPILRSEPQKSDIRLRLYSATMGVGDGGRGLNNGVWEWTSTVFYKHEGFEPPMLYPGFSEKKIRQSS